MVRNKVGEIDKDFINFCGKEFEFYFNDIGDRDKIWYIFLNKYVVGNGLKKDKSRNRRFS